MRYCEAELGVDLSGYIKLAITAARLPIKSPHILSSASFSTVQHPTNPHQIFLNTCNLRSTTWKIPEQK
jgi:hypothetical protein